MKMLHWENETIKLNASKEIKRGQVVVDYFGAKGVVVKIIPGPDEEDHGTIYVWQSERDEYGADNCEHYCYFNWRSYIRILEE